VAGIFNLYDVCKLIVVRARWINGMPKEGKMVAIFASKKKGERCDEGDG
jgi:hypothetical protein